MAKWCIYGKLESEAYKGMIANPHNRREQAGALLQGIGLNISAYYLSNGPDFDFLITAEGPDNLDRNTLFAGYMVPLSSGSFKELNIVEIITAEEAEEAMRAAQSMVSGYRPPAG